MMTEKQRREFYESMDTHLLQVQRAAGKIAENEPGLGLNLAEQVKSLALQLRVLVENMKEGRL